MTRRASGGILGAGLVGIAGAFLLSCPRPVTFPEIDARPPSALPSTRELNGLRVGVDPYLSRERVARSFGADLLSRGIFPVLVAVENGTGAIFSLEKNRFSLVRLDEGGPGAASITPRLTGEKGGVAAAKALWKTFGVGAFIGALLTFSPAGVALVPSGIVIEHHIANRQRVRNHLVASQLVDRTLHPEQSARGFVFFQLDQPQGLGDGPVGLYFQIDNISDEATWEFLLPIETARVPVS